MRIALTTPIKSAVTPVTPQHSRQRSSSDTARSKASTSKDITPSVSRKSRPETIFETPSEVHTPTDPAKPSDTGMESLETTPSTYATPSQGRLNRKKSSVADLRVSFEKLAKASPQKVVRRFSLNSDKPLPKLPSTEPRDRSSTMFQFTPSRAVHGSTAGTGEGKSPSDETPSTTKGSTRQLLDSRKRGVLVSSAEAEGQPDYSYAKLETLSPICQKAAGSHTESRGATKDKSPISLGPERPTVPTRKSSIPPSGPLHPFLRQQNSSANKIQSQKASATAKANLEHTKISENQQHPSGHRSSKVKNLAKMYELQRASNSGFLCMDMDQHTPEEGLIRYLDITAANDAQRSKAGTGDEPVDEPQDDATSRSRNKLRKKKHQSPLKEKVSMFESLGRPASRLGGKLSSRARSFETGAVLKAEEVTNGIKKLAHNGTRMWRRLSGSFDKEREKYAAAAASTDAPEGKTSSFRLLSSGVQQQHNQNPVPQPGLASQPRTTRTSRRESSFLVEGTVSRIPIPSDKQQPRTNTNSRETSDSSTSEIRDFAIDGLQEPRIRSQASHPVLPSLDFDVDGAPDMLGYFERNFDINFSVTERGTSVTMGQQQHRSNDHQPNRSSRNSYSPKTSARPTTNSAIPGPPIPPRHPGRRIRGSDKSTTPSISRKSLASPVLSIHEVRGIRHQLPERRRKPARSAGEASQQRVWDTRRGVVRSEEEEGIYNAQPARSVKENSENDVVVPVVGAECGLAHPRPSRVLNLKRFVGFCRERSGGLGHKL
jgi:hypothetical protein